MPFYCKFTSYRRRGEDPRPFFSWDSYFTHTKRCHLLTHSMRGIQGEFEALLFLCTLPGRHDAHEPVTITRLEGIRCVPYTHTNSLSAGGCNKVDPQHRTRAAPCQCTDNYSEKATLSQRLLRNDYFSEL